jgi:glycosyltransferase involved in cell wall biosynthesis
MACGRPVVALGRGGACETVVPGTTGWLVPEATDEAFAAAMREAETTSVDGEAIARHAAGFSVDRFEDGFRAIVTRAVVGTAC